MKKLFLTLSTVFALTFFISCSTEDNQESSDTSLNGTWKLTSLSLENPLDLNNDGISASNVLDELSLINATLELSNDGNGTVIYESEVSFNTRVENNNLVFMVASSISSEQGALSLSYSKTDSMVVIDKDVTFNKVNDNMSILNINGNNLIMKVVDGFIVKDINTSEVTVSQDIIYNFTKQN